MAELLRDPTMQALLAGALAALIMQGMKRLGLDGTPLQNKVQAAAWAIVTTIAATVIAGNGWNVTTFVLQCVGAFAAAGGVWATTMRTACATTPEVRK